MKYKLAAYAFAPLLGLTLVGGNIASAHGLFDPSVPLEQIAVQKQIMFQAEADLLGISIDEIKNGWAQGKTLTQIASEHGISKAQLTQKMAVAAQLRVKAAIQALVAKGVIIQAQADLRLSFLAKQLGSGKGKKWLHGLHRGHDKF